ncbi:hypothetical protein HOT42_gp90 [Microbacterium phage Metamorphoo]|uniref:Uncharacterized protein n=1 Tax=Microbacterium phage Metamorphoo TaxID=2201437 RepID=A0A2Z4Q6P2_9CAUD|nr:hypothetical protein HOT42_gp90 [Microbacterium phage Metamorphoo]AWY05439.1 hypothetical protein SEA_METAMORPHOO_89 [Microbacterium phage Metamorphoo]
MSPTPTTAEAVWVYTIYDHPSDYPDDYVLRAWRVQDGAVVGYDVSGKHPDLEEVRRMIPEGRHRIGRMQDDDPAILESWV